jgi:hypothetical protein
MGTMFMSAPHIQSSDTPRHSCSSSSRPERLRVQFPQTRRAVVQPNFGSSETRPSASTSLLLCIIMHLGMIARIKIHIVDREDCRCRAEAGSATTALRADHQFRPDRVSFFQLRRCLLAGPPAPPSPKKGYAPCERVPCLVSRSPGERNFGASWYRSAVWS